MKAVFVAVTLLILGSECIAKPECILLSGLHLRNFRDTGSLTSYKRRVVAEFRKWLQERRSELTPEQQLRWDTILSSSLVFDTSSSHNVEKKKPKNIEEILISYVEKRGTSLAVYAQGFEMVMVEKDLVGKVNTLPLLTHELGGHAMPDLRHWIKNTWGRIFFRVFVNPIDIKYFEEKGAFRWQHQFVQRMVALQTSPNQLMQLIAQESGLTRRDQKDLIRILKDVEFTNGVPTFKKKMDPTDLDSTLRLIYRMQHDRSVLDNFRKNHYDLYYTFAASRMTEEEFIRFGRNKFHYLATSLGGVVRKLLFYGAVGGTIWSLWPDEDDEKK